MSKITTIACQKAAQSAKVFAREKLQSALGMIQQDCPDDAIYCIEKAGEHLKDWIEADRVCRLLKPPTVKKGKKAA